MASTIWYDMAFGEDVKQIEEGSLPEVPPFPHFADADDGNIKKYNIEKDIGTVVPCTGGGELGGSGLAVDDHFEDSGTVVPSIGGGALGGSELALVDDYIVDTKSWANLGSEAPQPRVCGPSSAASEVRSLSDDVGLDIFGAEVGSSDGGGGSSGGEQGVGIFEKDDGGELTGLEQAVDYEGCSYTEKQDLGGLVLDARVCVAAKSDQMGEFGASIVPNSGINEALGTDWQKLADENRLLFEKEQRAREERLALWRLEHDVLGERIGKEVACQTGHVEFGGAELGQEELGQRDQVLRLLAQVQDFSTELGVLLGADISGFLEEVGAALQEG